MLALQSNNTFSVCDVQDFVWLPLTRVLGLAYFTRSKRLAVS